NAIHLAAHVLSMTSAKDAPARRQADVVTRSVARIQHIVDDLLDLSRQREGAGFAVQTRPSDMRLLCERIVEEVKAIATDRAVTFECEADGQGEWDEHRILQAISNLTSNAVQHGEPGSPVRVRLRGDAQRVV